MPWPFFAESQVGDHVIRNAGDHKGPYTGRFFRKGTSEVRCVILSAVKDLSPGTTQILHCAQHDSLWRPVRFKKPPRVSHKGPHPPPHLTRPYGGSIHILLA